MLRQTILGAAVLFATLAAPACGQEVKMQFKFKEGDKFYVEDVTKSKETIGAGCIKQTSDNKVTMVTSFEVKKVTTDSCVLAMKVESVKVVSKEALLGKIMEKLKGANFTVTLGNDGTVKGFEGYNDWVKSIAGDDDDQSKLLKSFLTESLFTNIIQNGFGFLPPKAVKKGDSWSNESKIPFSFLGEFKSKNTYTYEGKEGNLDVIAVKQQMKYTPPKAGTEIYGGALKLTRADLKAENVQGKFLFDSAKGRLASAEVSMTVSGSLTVDVGGNQQQLDLSEESTGTSRVLEKNPAKE
jgi:hypothetical protein